MKRFKSSHPQAFALCTAFLVSAFGYVALSLDFGASGDGAASILQRTAFMAAAVLLLMDCVEGWAHQKGKTRSLKDPVFWLYAFYMGYFWLTLMLLMLWNGNEPAQITLGTMVLGAVFFGIAMALFPSGTDDVPSSKFDLSKPNTEGPYRALYYLYPVFLVVFFVGAAWAFPSSLSNESQFFFRLIMLGSIMLPYEYKRERYWWNALPRMLGIAIVLIGYFAL